MDEPKEQPIEEEVTKSDYPPLWLPPGSIRAIMALILTITACGLVYTGAMVPEWFISLVTGYVSGYFIGRNTTK